MVAWPDTYCSHTRTFPGRHNLTDLSYTYTIYVCTCVYVCKYVYMCLCMYACMYVCVCMYVCMCVCRYVCMYVCVCMYLFIMYVCTFLYPPFE